MVWTPFDLLPGYETENGKLRSVARALRVVFRKPREAGETTDPAQVITHPHTEPRDPMGTIIPPTRNIGPTQVNVMDFGAAANGVTDDTDAWQAAIDSLPAAGGTVYGPNGDYLIDAERSINLRSHVRIQRDLNCKLIAKPTANSVYAILRAELVDDIEIDGGQIIGERDGHLGTGGEQGHGVLILGCNRVTIKNLYNADCWGDGVKVGGARNNRTQSSDVVGTNIVSTNNRRQALSITNANKTRWYDSDFTNTNGTAPQCGLDIEPNAETTTGGTAEDHYFENVNFDDNYSSGAHMQRRNKRVTFKRCNFRRNGKKGIEAVEVNDLHVEDCTIKENAGAGFTTSSESSNVNVSGNLFRENLGKAPRATPIEQAGVVSGTKNDLSIGASSRTIGVNRYE